MNLEQPRMSPDVEEQGRRENMQEIIQDTRDRVEQIRKILADPFYKDGNNQAPNNSELETELQKKLAYIKELEERM